MSERPLPVGSAPSARPVIMGVVNVTPDSFSDGGEWFDPDDAIENGLALWRQGAQILDVGGESTRPGAERPSVSEELRRVVPVVAALNEAGCVVSVDTMRAGVAEAAIGAGAAYLNDVSGGLADPAMVPLAVESGLPFIAMHWRGHSADMQTRAVYGDVVAEVCRELAGRRDAALAAGIAPDRLVLDPGLGFAKLPEHNWALTAHLDEVIALGHPVLYAASRKGFLGKVGRLPSADPRPADARDVATAATSVLAAQAGVWAVRVHDVRGTRDALDVVEATRAAGAAPDQSQERLFFHPRFFLHGPKPGERG